MNERIKELSKEAGLVADATYAKAPDAVWLKEYNKKFAELIVKDCAIIANRAENTETEIRCMYDVITEHFGVEE